jgi:hypothetical protein
VATRDLWNLLTVKAMGTPVLKGTITSTTTKNNTDTAVPFLNSAAADMSGKLYALQPDAACYFLPVTSSAGTVTSATGVYMSANDIKTIAFHQDYPYLAVLSADGSTCNMKVWELI